MIQLQNLSLRRGGRLLLEAVDVRIQPGQKVGVVGANGCGKSSLFALLLGELHADAGEVLVPAAWRVAHVAQQTPSGPRPAIELVLDGDQELRQIERQLAAAEAAGDGLRVAELHGRLEAIDGYGAPSRAARLLHGLGFAPGDEQRPIDSYSGGWRMRLALACTLMGRSDLMLLDEPTNHLDLDAVIWLEGWLRAYPGTLLLISHDKDFLDAIAGQILHVEGRTLQLYAGNYSAFERQRAERLAQQQAAFEHQQREVAQIHQFVERFRAKASKARQAQSRIKALQRMEQLAPAHVDSPFRFAFPPLGTLPHPLLRLEGAIAGYDGHRVLSGIDLSIAPGDRIGLLGPNGAGKSTLIKLLAGLIPLLGGRRETAQALQIGYFAQHQVDQLRPDDSPLAHLQRLEPRTSDQELRDFLGGFDFSGERALEPVAPFSGGEKARLVLALLVRQRPSLLLLDEPTNHLDLEMRHALARALQVYEGALVLVSHDRHLLRITTDRLLLVDRCRVTDFDGELDDYPAWLANRASAERAAGGAEREAGSRRVQRREDAIVRQRLQPLKRRFRELDQRLAQLTHRRDEIERQLAAPELYSPDDKERLLALLDEKRRVDDELQEVETSWLEVGEALEQLGPAAG
ncbi:ATPase component of ABC transporters with duplicated ATPase domain [Thioflavicoccus mobilis 8321]|uniref:Probable ATP-binding protein YheS n=1 Tax=Thioflavicoccus mobilis 8321 TaxID=765912 RepID=L0GT53_9GAMM|nr:ATP-binding cassette domain-containing protein [Thioflavicoccus mobilis]AGA88977.1 ATPase component of ABC transporters with duplicated ATPase domain [Thioflavicoccus mobilis 8321]